MGILVSEGRGCSWSLPDPHPWICNSDRGRGVRGPRLAGGGAGGTRALLSAGSPQPSLRPEPQWQSRRAVSAPSWATDNGLLHAHEKQAARARPVRVFLIDAQRMLPTTAFEQAHGRHSESSDSPSCRPKTTERRLSQPWLWRCSSRPGETVGPRGDRAQVPGSAQPASRHLLCVRLCHTQRDAVPP